MLKTSLLALMALVMLPACTKEPEAADPNQVVQQLLTGPTAFNDAMYNQYTVATFFQSGLADKTIDLNNPDYNLLNAAVFYETNRYRESKGRTALKFSPELRNAAFYHSYTMVEMKFYSHNNTKVKGMKTAVERSNYFGYPSAFVGENIDIEFVYDYTGSDSYFVEESEGVTVYVKEVKGKDVIIPVYTYAQFAKAIVTEWINSAPHRENMLNKDYKEMGCGAYPDKSKIGGDRIPDAAGTQVFGNPGSGMY